MEQKTTNWRRSLYHILGGLVIPLAAFFLPGPLVLISVGILTFVYLTVDIVRLKVPVVNKWFFKYYRFLTRPDEKSGLTGTSYLLVGSLVSLLVFPRDIAILALAFLAIGDPVAGLVGRRLGKRRLFGKTLEGDLAGLTSCIAIGAVFYFAGLNLTWLIILVGAVIASAAESSPIPINDNLTIPLFSGAVMTLIYLFI
jgi:acyl phosphate:glycerol-3-phosphate acyltransferase